MNGSCESVIPGLRFQWIAAASACALALFFSGCAAVGGRQGERPASVVQAMHLDDVIPKSLPALPALPELPRFDPARFAAENRAPSNDRDWVPELKELAYAEFSGDKVTIRNVRNAEFFSYRDCLVDYYYKTYDLSQIKSVDFVQIPFAENRAIAHTMLSFGFENGDYVGVSAEVRLEKGESYSAAVGLLGQFELIYVVADERDLLPVRAEHRDVDVFLFRTTATPAQARLLFVDVLKRVNQLHDKPEFYDTLSNNCTTNIVRHINKLAPGKVPHDYRVLLPGYADSLAYDLGLIDRTLPLDEVKRKARVTDLILRYRDDPNFSQRIRGEKRSAQTELAAKRDQPVR